MAIAIDSIRRLGWRIAILLAIASLLLLGGCSGAANGDEDAAEPEPGAVTIEESGELAGALHAIPEVLEPGRTIRVATENVGSVPLFYGLSWRVERYVDGQWEEGLSQAVAAVGLGARPGEREGPRYGPHVIDQIELPADLEPGIYRVLKDVGPSLRETGELTLAATFEVRSADGVAQEPADQ